MTKSIITLFIIAAAVAAFRILTPDSHRAIGDPVLSLTPEPSPSASPSVPADDTVSPAASVSFRG